jgi:hypothetical protein
MEGARFHPVRSLVVRDPSFLPTSSGFRYAQLRSFSFNIQLPKLLLDQFLQLHDVGGEAPDTVGQFFGGHGIFVDQLAEGFFVQIETVD